jgi:hypothetical protein
VVRAAESSAAASDLSVSGISGGSSYATTATAAARAALAAQAAAAAAMLSPDQLISSLAAVDRVLSRPDAETAVRCEAIRLFGDVYDMCQDPQGLIAEAHLRSSASGGGGVGGTGGGSGTLGSYAVASAPFGSAGSQLPDPADIARAVVDRVMRTVKPRLLLALVDKASAVRELSLEFWDDRGQMRTSPTGPGRIIDLLTGLYDPTAEDGWVNYASQVWCDPRGIGVLDCFFFVLFLFFSPNN